MRRPRNRLDQPDLFTGRTPREYLTEARQSLAEITRRREQKAGR